MLTNNALYPWGTSVGKDKHGLSIGISICSVKFKHERNAIMQHQPVFKLHPVRLPVEPPQMWSPQRSQCNSTQVTWSHHSCIHLLSQPTLACASVACSSAISWMWLFRKPSYSACVCVWMWMCTWWECVCVRICTFIANLCSHYCLWLSANLSLVTMTQCYTHSDSASIPLVLHCIRSYLFGTKLLKSNNSTSWWLKLRGNFPHFLCGWSAEGCNDGVYYGSCGDSSIVKSTWSVSTQDMAAWRCTPQTMWCAQLALTFMRYQS